MSVKIWTAYRVPIGRLLEFTDYIHNSMFFNAVEIVKRYMTCVKHDYILESLGNRIGLYSRVFSAEDLKDPIKEELVRFELVMDKAKAASINRERSAFCLDCGFNVWFDEEYAYIIPITDIVNYSVPNWAEDYHYQNQVDPPDDVPSDEYEKRYHKWDELCLNDHNTRRFYHSVIDMSPLSVSSIVKLQLEICQNFMRSE